MNFSCEVYPIYQFRSVMKALWIDSAVRLRLIVLVAVLGFDTSIAYSKSSRHSAHQSSTGVSSPQSAALADRTIAVETRIRYNDSLATLFSRLQINDLAALRYLQGLRHLNLHQSSQLREGSGLYAQRLPSGKLHELYVMIGHDKDTNTLHQLHLTRDSNSSSDSPTGFKHRMLTITPTQSVQMQQATIKRSLFQAADEAMIPDRIITQLAHIFRHDLDFYHQLQAGDRLRVHYEIFLHEGRYLDSGKVLSAELDNHGVLYRATWFGDDAQGLYGLGDYYSDNGKTTRKTFLQAPIAYTRISSGFGLRTHPFLHTWRMHKGVDFPAPQGTPVYATADGYVASMGHSGGYGNLVTLDHGKGYGTAYGHLSEFGAVSVGSRIRQGDVIGFVGATGWATASHLHYEFRINGQAVDPTTATMNTILPLEGERWLHFKQRVARYR
jgi:murein DD-endopeptidase MepM/ murein hydrolase activator NlpD